MRASGRITILYEDQRGPIKEFGLHKLITACVFDEVNGDPREVALRLEECPKKGNSKLLSAIENDLENIAMDGRPVLAVFDDDRVRLLLKLDKSASEEKVIDEIKQRSVSSANLFVFLLKENLETVVRNIAECMPGEKGELVKKASKKDLEARDALFNAISHRKKSRETRDCVLAKNSSLKSIVHKLCELIRLSARSREEDRA